MHRLTVVLPGLCIVLVLSSVLCGCATPSALTKGPYIQNPSSTAMTVQWETDRPGTGKVCFRRAEGADDAELTVEGRLFEGVRARTNPKDTRYPATPRYLYRARLLNLEPDTEYVYRVSTDFAPGSVAADLHRFRTWPEEGPDRVTFISYGDSRTQPRFHRAMIRQFESYGLAFIVHNGDLVIDGNRYDVWGPEYFEPLRDMIDHIPMMIARGNHEEGARNVLRFFDMPGGKLNYSFDYGPVHVIMLDMEKPTPEVLAWLTKDLAETTAPWRIAVYHHPTFNFEGHRSDEYRTTFLPLFEEYGVDLVMAGHTHHYERFVPFCREGYPKERPITFVTVGGGGAPLYPATRSPLLARAVSTYCFSVVTVTADELSLKVITDKGKEIDSFAVRRTPAGLDAEYLVRARRMEEAIVEQGLSKLAVAPVAPVPPGEPLEIKVKGTFPGLEEPVAVEVRLSEGSAKFYSMAPVLGWMLPADKEPQFSVYVRSFSKTPPSEKETKDPMEPKQASAATPLFGKKPARFPDIRLVLTARAAGVERTRQVGGIAYGIAARPGLPKPTPWAVKADKTPAPVGKTYKPPLNEEQRKALEALLEGKKTANAG